MTPYEIGLLLHAYCRPEPFHNMEVPIANEAVRKFLDEGLIEVRGNNPYFSTTERGSAHVRQLCNLPLPTQAWIGADGKVIDSV